MYVHRDTYIHISKIIKKTFKNNLDVLSILNFVFSHMKNPLTFLAGKQTFPGRWEQRDLGAKGKILVTYFI